MSQKLSFSTKRLAIDKANASMVLVISVSTFIFIFSVIAVKALWSQRAYQQRVIAKKVIARDQLKKNIDSSKALVTSYQSFVGQPQNVIGGNPNGTANKDGDNAKIILDALPSKYDFPALANSLSALVSTAGVRGTVNGTDDELAQEKNVSTDNPKPVEIPFTTAVSGSYASIKNLISVFEHSIRPVKIDTITFSGSDAELTVSITARTYYQPAKSLTIKTEEVK